MHTCTNMCIQHKLSKAGYMRIQLSGIMTPYSLLHGKQTPDTGESGPDGLVRQIQTRIEFKKVGEVPVIQATLSIFITNKQY